MGNVVPTGRLGGDGAALVTEFEDGRYVPHEVLRQGKFLKSVQCLHNGQRAVVKAYEKVPGATDARVLQHLRQQLEEIRDAFDPQLQPNVLPYSRWGETPKACLLVRQFLSSDLYDRQSTRPFLDTMEKRWIAFQLLKALSQCHNAKVVHGDIKAENVLVTSWNWVMVADFAPFKPTYLPLDDTAPFNYFFANTSGKRDCCCVAPERFCSPTSISDISLLQSAPPQCASFLSVMMDSNVPVIDADHEMAEAAASLGEEADATKGAGDAAGDKASTRSPASPASPRAARQRSYSFNTSSRSTRLRPSMDIFSLGCVIMELFQDGEPCFALSEVLRYAKRGEENDGMLRAKLVKLSYPRAAPLLEHMLGDDPARRLSADAYLQAHSGAENKLFPAFFGDFLHPFLSKMLSPKFDSPDERLWAIAQHYGAILEQLCGAKDTLGSAYFEARYSEWANWTVSGDAALPPRAVKVAQDGAESVRAKLLGSSSSDATLAAAAAAGRKGRAAVVRDLLDETARLLDGLAKLNNAPGLQSSVQRATKQVALQRRRLNEEQDPSAAATARRAAQEQQPRVAGMEALDFDAEIPGAAEAAEREDNGAVLVLSLLCSTVRFVRFPSTKAIGLRLMQRLCCFTNDDTRLQRVLPFVVDALSDQASVVRCTALRVLTSLVCMIEELPPADHSVFPDYIFPALQRLSAKPDTSLNVRVTLAECLPRLAEASARFLELSHLHELRARRSREHSVPGDRATSSGSKPSGASKHAPRRRNFDAELGKLRDIVQNFVNATIEQAPIVRRALLCDITRLCLFLGRERTSGQLLPILITFLNDSWELRATFFEHIAGVSAMVGPSALQHFLLPCIDWALKDAEELVTARALICLFAHVQLGLFNSVMTEEVAVKALPLVLHPGAWIRHAVVRLLAALVSSDRLSLVEVQVKIVSLLKPVMRPEAVPSAVLLGYSKDIEENEQLLREMLQEPLDRAVFDAAVAQLEAGGSASALSSPTTGATTTTASTSAPEPGSSVPNSSSSSSSSSSWLNIKTKQSQDGGTASKDDPSERSQGLDAASTALETASAAERAKLDTIKPVLAASVGARRIARTRPGDTVRELPAEYQLQSNGADLYSLVVPDQRFVTLAVTTNYSDMLNQVAPSMAAGSFLLHTQAAFKDIVNRHGIMVRSRRKGGAHGPGTNEAISSGVTRLVHRIRALEVPPLPPDMGALRRVENKAAFVAHVRRPSASLGSLCDEEAARHPSTRDAAATPTDKPWRPRGVLAANLYGHEGAVNRICTSQDSLFFATGSDDGKVHLWLTAGLEDGYGVRPRLTYASQGGCITDLCMVENTHSVASASTAGSVHVFRVDHAVEATRQCIDPSDTGAATVAAAAGLGGGPGGLGGTGGSSGVGSSGSVSAGTGLGGGLGGGGGLGEAGREDLLLDRAEARRRLSMAGRAAPEARVNLAATTVLELDVQREGAVRAVCHFPTMTQSMLAFACDSGTIHGWDIRRQEQAWTLRVGPQAGFITSVVVPPEGDALWLVAGTSRGLLLLFDLRFQVLLRAWRHPSRCTVHRLHISRATCSDPFVFVAAGENAFALYNLASGEAIHTYKTVPTSASAEAARVDQLEAVDIAALSPLSGPDRLGYVRGTVGADVSVWRGLAIDELDASRARCEPSVRAMLCPFDTFTSASHHAHIPSTVISAGSDRRIRYWDADSALGYAIFDQEFGVATKQQWDTLGNVSMCREDLVRHEELQPNMEGRGLPHPSSNHDDAILDLAFVGSHSAFQAGTAQKCHGFLLSASRDGVVKAWV